MDNRNADIFQDNSCHGEDAYLMRELGPGMAMDCVLDGVTHCEGAYASGFTRDLLAKGPIAGLDDALALLRQANDVLFQAGRGRNLLTTVALVFYREGLASVLSAGDSAVYLVRDGDITALTPLHEARELDTLSGGAIGLRQTLALDSATLDVQSGDMMLLATDGLISNLSDAEMCAALGESGFASEAVGRLRARFIEKRHGNLGREGAYGGFKEDDATAVVRFIP